MKNETVKTTEELLNEGLPTTGQLSRELKREVKRMYRKVVKYKYQQSPAMNGLAIMSIISQPGPQEEA